MPVVGKSFGTQDGGIRYWVDRLEATAPWLVFLPGLTADHTLFDPQMSYFSGKANLLVWDAPGHGESRPYQPRFSIDDCARALMDILSGEGAIVRDADEAGITAPILVGQSFGGYVAQAFMDLFPSSASGFVSIDSAPLQKRYYKRWEISSLRHTLGPLMCIPWKMLMRWSSEQNAFTLEGKRNMREMMLPYSKRAYCKLAAHGFDEIADAIVQDRAYGIDCQALLLCGEHDKAGFVRRYNRDWAGFTGIPILWVPDAGHNSNVDNPGFVNGEIERFLERIAG